MNGILIQNTLLFHKLVIFLFKTLLNIVLKSLIETTSLDTLENIINLDSLISYSGFLIILFLLF